MSRLLILFVACASACYATACAPGGVGLDPDAGDANVGPMGDGGPADSGLPVTEAPLGRLSLGGAHTCWLDGFGVTYCWGSNNRGQLGDGTLSGHATPKKVVDIPHASALAGKTSQNCAITGQGDARCWGSNNYGQLGTGSSAELRSSPVLVASVSSVAELSVGALHMCARVAAGVPWCWGANLSGSLGRGNEGGKALPGPVNDLTGTLGVSSGTSFSCVVTSTGGVSCWGRNSQGQLGDGTQTDHYAPVAVVGLPETVKSVSAGDSHACALGTSGDVFCWGANGYGQTGTGAISATPVLVPTKVSGIDKDAVAVDAASQTTCALRSTGTLACWGSNATKQLGDVVEESRPTAVDVAGLSSVKHFGVGGGHVCAATAVSVMCWGSNTLGQLGFMSDMTEVPTPTAVVIPDGLN